MTMITIMTIIINLLIILFLPLLFIGIINRVKSLWSGRQGPSLFQPFFDFFRLLKKGEVISQTTSFIFRLAPSFILASVLAAAVVTPMITGRSLIGFQGDFIFFAYFIAVGKFFSIISALDTSSSFEGMGASREATFSVFVEPAFFLVMGSLCLMSGTTDFQSLFSFLGPKSDMALLVKGMGAAVIFVLVLVEGCRVPIDDPNTHLELTMIHEVIILDNSGPDLAFIQYASALRMVLFSCLIPNLFIPADMALLPATLLFLVFLLMVAIAIGMIESFLARLRMIHVPQFIFLMVALSIAVLSALIVFNHGAGV